LSRNDTNAFLSALLCVCNSASPTTPRIFTLESIVSSLQILRESLVDYYISKHTMTNPAV
jgi:hypothetical protein